MMQELSRRTGLKIQQIMLIITEAVDTKNTSIALILYSYSGIKRPERKKDPKMIEPGRGGFPLTTIGWTTTSIW